MALVLPSAARGVQLRASLPSLTEPAVQTLGQVGSVVPTPFSIAPDPMPLSSVIRLGPNTDFLVNSLDTAESEFFLGIGRLVAKLRSLAAGREVRFRTATAVAAVRGTELAVEQENDDAPTRVGVFDEGQVVVSSHDGADAV